MQTSSNKKQKISKLIITFEIKANYIFLNFYYNFIMSVKQIDGYKIYMGEVLGTGSYGSVYVGKCDKNGDKVAIKVL
jgi:hypothetical protein